ncbi:SH3 domain-containing protein, partial [Schizophyllum amplum]
KALPPPRIFKAPSQRGNKYTRALYDFSGVADELLFRRGDEIAAISKVTDEWWVGELAGRRGLFPTSYV